MRKRPSYLLFRVGRATPGYHHEPVKGARLAKLRLRRKPACRAPMRHQGIFDARRPDDKTCSRRTPCPENPSDLLKRRLVQHVKENDFSSFLLQCRESFIEVVRLQAENIHQTDLLLRLPRKMQGEITFRHRGNRMRLHGGMPVNAVDAAIKICKEMTKERVASHCWYAHHHRHVRHGENLLPNFQCLADAPYFRGTIEGGAYFVMADRRSQLLQLHKNRL